MEEEGVMDKYTLRLRNILSDEGFDALSGEQADDVLETLSDIVADLAFCGWRYNDFTRFLRMAEVAE
jgi:hypothetical protein